LLSMQAASRGRGERMRLGTCNLVEDKSMASARWHPR
jgi:hypothetical protein